MFLYIRYSCNKNCKELVNASYTVETEFEVNCTYNCEEINDDDYLWTVEYASSNDTLNFDNNKDSHFGRSSKNFFIKENVLKGGIDYKITVKLQPEKKKPGMASLIFSYYNKPSITDCGMQPSPKEKEKYIVECKDDNVDENDLLTHYEIFARDPDGNFFFVILLFTQHTAVATCSNASYRV